MYPLLFSVAALPILIPPILFIRKPPQAKRLKKASAVAAIVAIMVCVVLFTTGFSGRADAASEAAPADLSKGLGYMAAALSTGMACIGAGIAVAVAASAAIGASAEDPSMVGRVLIFVAIGEGVTLFGLLVSIMILGRL